MLLCVGAADSVVGEDSGEFPVRSLLTVLGVVCILSLVACFLFL